MIGWSKPKGSRGSKSKSTSTCVGWVMHKAMSRVVDVAQTFLLEPVFKAVAGALGEDLDRVDLADTEEPLEQRAIG